MANQERHNLTLPGRISGLEELHQVCADRFRRIGEILRTFGNNAAFDFNGQRARNLGRATDASDGVTLGQLHESIARLRASVSPAASGSSAINLGITGAAIELVQVSLTTATTAITVTGATAGLVIALMLEQDGTGGRAVTWPTTWRGVQNLQPDPTANTYSVVLIGFLSPTEGRLLGAPARGIPLT